MSINQKHDRIHVQWYKHAARTAMGEIHDERELFLTNVCADVHFYAVVGKVKCRFLKLNEDIPLESDPNYFCRYALVGFFPHGC